MITEAPLNLVLDYANRNKIRLRPMIKILLLFRVQACIA